MPREAGFARYFGVVDGDTDAWVCTLEPLIAAYRWMGWPLRS